MKIGRSIKIFGVRYKIRQVSMPKVGEDIVMGSCDSVKKIITLATELNPKDRMHTFLHELCHAVLLETGVSPVLNAKIEEIIIDNLSKTISEFILKKGQK